jgi:plastocyanin
MTRISALIAALLAALVLAASTTAMSQAKLVGTVGPSFTIFLTKGGKKVTKLNAGTYSLYVNDKGNIHSFHITGPGLNKVVTSVTFVGKKTVTIKLKRGKYNYFCDPHKATMHGSFRVV